ncbi:MAG TPA: diacylglycerol kinase family protein [Candidatus Omnitrophica bacterium]|nr:diacylglycerol kinase family protein [Candidatus Omnitrophota bacterium]
MIILIIVINMVFVSEVFNTLLENVFDYLKSENDPRIKILKDISSAAVLITCIEAIIIGFILLLPK